MHTKWPQCNSIVGKRHAQYALVNTRLQFFCIFVEKGSTAVEIHDEQKHGSIESKADTVGFGENSLCSLPNSKASPPRDIRIAVRRMGLVINPLLLDYDSATPSRRLTAESIHQQHCLKANPRSPSSLHVALAKAVEYNAGLSLCGGPVHGLSADSLKQVSAPATKRRREAGADNRGVCTKVVQHVFGVAAFNTSNQASIRETDREVKL